MLLHQPAIAVVLHRHQSSTGSEGKLTPHVVRIELPGFGDRLRVSQIAKDVNGGSTLILHLREHAMCFSQLPTHFAGTFGVVIDPIRASLRSAGAPGVSVPGLLRVTCDPYSPTIVSLTVVRTENPETSAGPRNGAPVWLHVRFGIPSMSIGERTVRPPR